MHLFLVKVEEGSGCLAARVLAEQHDARLSCYVMLPGEKCLQISSVGSFLFIAAAVLNEQKKREKLHPRLIRNTCVSY